MERTVQRSAASIKSCSPVIAACWSRPAFQSLAASALPKTGGNGAAAKHLIEGDAEFTAELISSQVSSYQFIAEPKGDEKEIVTAFVSDEDKTDLSKWLYNGTLEKPGDLGYWIGYRVVKSYYNGAADKREAFRKILQISDPKGFVSKSGWYPGVPLQ